jgi:hypothetical protein
MKHKTQRGDRGDRINVLTNSGDGRRWPDFEEDGSGRPWGPARSPCNSAERWTSGDGNEFPGRGSASRTSLRCWLAPEDGGGGARQRRLVAPSSGDGGGAHRGEGRVAVLGEEQG